MKQLKIIGVAVLFGTALLWLAIKPGSEPSLDISESGSTTLVDVKIPASFSDAATKGKALFDANCAQCHGPNAAGQDGNGPPLVHVIYEPSHHGDVSFQRAAALGVRGHHWPFGDMPPIENIGPSDVDDIIEYVRELQRANGIN